jgi:glycosyltransferase involved in cell wall biosynthesis
MRWPGELAAAAGYDVTVFDPGPMHGVPVKVGLDPLKRPSAVLTGDIEFDVIVFQRPLNWRVQFAIQLLQHHGVRCVVEVDDDLGNVHAQHDAYAYVHPTHNPEANHTHLARACAVADAVVVTTPALARRYGQERAVIVENHIPRRYLDQVHEPDPAGRIVIGWTGKVGSHAGDLNVLRGAMQQVLRNHPDAVMRVLGDNTGVDRVLGLDSTELVNGVSLDEYPVEVARFDIGVAPLADTAFNRSKSWLKPLDYSACGVPFVCSATDEYQRYTGQGCGFVADRARDWVRYLGQLIRSPSLRAEQAAAGREVAARWVMEDHIDRYVKAWAGVAGIRHTQPMATQEGAS